MDDALVRLQRVLERLGDILPTVEFSIDDEGQIVLHTGLYLRDRASLRPPPEEAPS